MQQYILTPNLVIKNNSSPSIRVLYKTNIIFPLGDCISESNNIYVGLTSTTLSIDPLCITLILDQLHIMKKRNPVLQLNFVKF